MQFAPSGFTACHAPAEINTVAVTNGFAPIPLDQEFIWADFACGDGLNAVIMAAANPKATIYAIGDGKVGRSMAEHAGLTNIVWRRGNVTDLTEKDLPPLDFAVCDGGLLILDEAERKHAFTRVSACLKPGGMLLLGYHALPGFAAMMPLRDVLHSLTHKHAATPRSRVRMALEWLDQSNVDSFGFLAEHTGIRQRLQAYGSHPYEIAAAELFGGNLVPFHFAQISGMLEQHGLNFAGNSALHLNMLDMALPPALRAALKNVKSRREFETLRDILRNAFYRRDVYVKGEPLTDTDTFLQQHGDLLVVNAAHDYVVSDRTVDLGGFTINFDGFPFKAIHENLTDGPLRVDDIPDVIPGIARDAVRSALAAGLVRPCAMEAKDKAHGEALVIPNAYNRLIMGKAANFDSVVPVASPVLGSGIFIDIREALVLGAVAATKCDFANASGACFKYLYNLLEVPEGDEQAHGKILLMIEDGLAALTPARLRYLAQLGIIQ